MQQAQTLLRGHQLRKRWGMSNTTFYRKVRLGVLPKPAYPFGDAVPYWSVADVEAFEQRLSQQKVAA